MNKLVTVVLLSLIIILPSCTDNEKGSGDKLDVVNYKEVELKISKENWSLFSFEENNSIIKQTKIPKDNSWDIAFFGLKGKTNGGTSGNSNVKVYRTNLKQFDNITSIASIIDSEFWKEDELLVNSIDIDNTETNNLQAYFQNSGWFNISDTKINVIEDIFIIKTSNSKYVKMQFATDSNFDKIKFKWDFVKDKGVNDVKINPHKLELESGEVTVTGKNKLEDLLAGKDLTKIKKLTITDKVLSQTDMNFIVDKMGNINVLDLTSTTFSFQSMDNCLKNCKNVKHVILPKNLVIINFGRLGYSNIEKVTFSGNNLTTIGNGVFAFSKIKQLELPNSLEILENGAFSVIQEITKIEIPEKVTIIPDDCFFACGKLETIIFKGKIRTIGGNMLTSCKKLKSLKFMSPKPPTFNDNENPFYKDKKNANIIKANPCTIYVPVGSIQAYSDEWKLDKKYFKEFN